MKSYSLILLALASANAVAGSSAAGTLGTFHFFDSGVGLVYTSGTRSGAPACAVNQGRFAFDGTTPGGKAQLAGLMSAYALGKTVVIVGTGNCAIYGDTESISYFYINE